MIMCMQAPFPFKASANSAASGWPLAEHCQFFELNCFRIAYEQADRELAELEGKPLPGHH